MKIRYLCCLVVALLQIMSCWVSATSRNLPTGTDISPMHSIEPIPSSEEDVTQEMIGSTPPNCESKCYGCSPCEAIQVPTINGHFSLQYSNYYPEGWKCKCGPFLYSP